MAEGSLLKSNFTKRSKRFLLSVSNASRSVMTSIFGLVITYILLRIKAPSVLNGYVYCISIVNLFLVVANWGGKDYSIKTLSQQPLRTAELLNSLLNSRLILAFLMVALVFLTPVDNEQRLFICLLLFLKSLSSVIETLVTFNRNFHTFLFVDLVLYLLFVGVLLFDGNKNDPDLFLVELVAFEFLRLVLSLFFFKGMLQFRFNFTGGWNMIRHSKLFFLISLAGFVCSRADLYIVGLVLSKEQMSPYFIIVNQVGLGLVVYATLINTFSASIFRFNTRTFNRFFSFSIYAGVLFALAASFGIYILSNFYYKVELSLPFLFLILINILAFTLQLTEMYRYTKLGQQGAVFRVLMLSGSINVVLSLFSTQRFGLIGAFAANTACMVLTYLLLRIPIQKTVDRD